MGQRDPHLMQGFSIALACRFMVCAEVVEVATGNDPKRGVARHRGIQLGEGTSRLR
jgi:hypothetical protein